MRRSRRHGLVVSAIVSVVLLLDAFVIAPASHRPGELHDHSNCAICNYHANGNIVPPPSPGLAQTALVELQPQPVCDSFQNPDLPDAFLIRGPPCAQMLPI